MFVPVMMTAQKAIVAKPLAPSITIKTAGVVVRAEGGVDAGWLADVLRGRRAGSSSAGRLLSDCSVTAG
jgi:hypothetical protein